MAPGQVRCRGRRIFVFGFALLSVAHAGGLSGQRAPVQQKILLLNGENGRSGDVADSAFRAVLNRDTTRRWIIHTELLEPSRFSNLQAEDIESLQRKYAEEPIDVVVALGGTGSVTQQLARIKPGVARLALVVDFAGQRWRPADTSVTGVAFGYDIAGTVEDALRLFPETGDLLVVAGSARLDSLLVQEARHALAGFEKRLRIRYTIGLPQSELESRLTVLSPGTAVLFLSMLRDGLGVEYVQRDLLKALTAVSPAPIFALSRAGLGTGIVGGRLLDLAEQGVLLAQLTLRVLNGEQPADIPIVRRYSHGPLFDVSELRRWQVSSNRLPPGSRTQLAEESLWRRYHWQIIAVLALCIFEALLIAGLLVQRHKRGKAEHLLADRLRFETVLADTSRTFTDVAGERVNPEMERWLGRIGGACGARQVAMMLVDDSGSLVRTLYRSQRFRSGADAAHIQIGASEMECIRRGLVVTRPFFHTRGGGSTLVFIPLAVSGRTWGTLALETPTATPFGEGVPLARLRVLGEVLANALARNHAAEQLVARTAALTESHAEYRRLADRLIEAQENERKRIARELHDDITQRLTLLGLQAGRIERGVGESSIVPRSALERLAEDLSRLIGDVSRLSHRLHPSLLERVGLSAAIRALCRDLSGQQGLHVSFSERDVPAKLPEAQSLAAYRVAQEALRNALKHSGAHLALVKLAAEDGLLVLEVSDDGNGFDPDSPQADSGLGLLSMTERVHVLDGTLSVESRPGAGTTVRMVLPLELGSVLVPAASVSERTRGSVA